MKAVLVDEEDLVRRFMGSVLECFGVDVHVFVDPTECLQHWRRHSGDVQNRSWADIVVTDVRMPRMSGLDFAKELISGGFEPERIAVMSGSWTDQDVKRLRALGCARFAKPIDLSEFKEWLNGTKMALSGQSESPLDYRQVCRD